MDANAWVWVTLIGFLVFCCLPMLFMKHDHGSHETRRADRSDKEQRDMKHD